MRTSELQDARDVVARLHLLSTPGSEVGVADEHKKAVQLFIRSWIIPQAERWLARVERRADKRRKHGGYEVGQLVEYEFTSGIWVSARVTDTQPARGVAHNRIPGKVAIRTLAGDAPYTIPWRSKRLRRTKSR